MGKKSCASNASAWCRRPLEKIYSISGIFLSNSCHSATEQKIQINSLNLTQSCQRPLRLVSGNWGVKFIFKLWTFCSCPFSTGRFSLKFSFHSKCIHIIFVCNIPPKPLCLLRMRWLYLRSTTSFGDNDSDRWCMNAPVAAVRKDSTAAAETGNSPWRLFWFQTATFLRLASSWKFAIILGVHRRVVVVVILQGQTRIVHLARTRSGEWKIIGHRVDDDGPTSSWLFSNVN